LDQYIVAQEKAKKAVAIALRNRWRRILVPKDIQDEIYPKNIIMIGPTGVGKTEISRRLAKMVRAPFVKVEATKFTEVGYVGRDVESIIRELVEVSFALVREEELERVANKAEKNAEKRILKVLLPSFGDYEEFDKGTINGKKETKKKLLELFRAGKLDKREVEIEIVKTPSAHMQVLGPQGFAEIEGQIKEMIQNVFPKQKQKKKVTVREAFKIFKAEEQEKLLDEEKIVEIALKRAEQNGVVFIDEIDKVCGRESRGGPDVSREGVQRDLLPLVEGCRVITKYGPVSTDHILFIASGAFHTSKPSDLMPEFQGRFPIRVELSSLSTEHFVRILTEPKNALTRQYEELLKTEGIKLKFTDDGIEEIARITAEVNSTTENIGARRLYTVMEKLLEDVSFEVETYKGKTVVVDKKFVQDKLKEIISDRDLSRYIL
ncbi:MAG: ATP-dependent protease ATPase subunit HslU, partial [Candidatus Dadabacteria bacterium]